MEPTGVYHPTLELRRCGENAEFSVIFLAPSTASGEELYDDRSVMLVDHNLLRDRHHVSLRGLDH